MPAIRSTTPPRGVTRRLIDPDAKSTYNDEFVAGSSSRRGRTSTSACATSTAPSAASSKTWALADGAPTTSGRDGQRRLHSSPTPARHARYAGSRRELRGPDPHYDAVEFTADKRFGNNWSLFASYRWSRLHGTFEGFYRDDNGQSDPGITSLFDFPTNDPSYTAIGVPQFGYRGDIRFLGALGAGRSPTDRPHQFKVYGNYAINWGLNLGAGLQLSSGNPLTAMAANPNYGNDGEIPDGPRGSASRRSTGSRRARRSSTTSTCTATTPCGWAERRIVLLADVFNLFNVQRATGYDQDTESTLGALNPDYGQPVITRIPQFQTPFQVRFGARFEFYTGGRD